MTTNTGRMMPRMRVNISRVRDDFGSRHRKEKSRPTLLRRGAGTVENWVPAGAGTTKLENVLRQIVVLHDAGELLVDVFRVDHHRLSIELGGIERDAVEQPFHDRVEPPGTDVLLLFVDLESNLGKASNAVVTEVELDTLGRKQRLILAR